MYDIKYIYQFYLHIRALVAVVLFMSLNSFPVQSFNALIIPILRDCLYLDKLWVLIRPVPEVSLLV